jgi:hypothetical protein
VDPVLGFSTYRITTSVDADSSGFPSPMWMPTVFPSHLPACEMVSHCLTMAPFYPEAAAPVKEGSVSPLLEVLGYYWA